MRAVEKKRESRSKKSTGGPLGNGGGGSDRRSTAATRGQRVSAAQVIATVALLPRGQVRRVLHERGHAAVPLVGAGEDGRRQALAGGEGGHA